MDKVISRAGAKMFANALYRGANSHSALANIFVGFHESRLFDNTVKLAVYFRYVDDTFVIFGSELDCFMKTLTCLIQL